MKLKSIKKVKKYKSFQDFTWQSFFNNETFHDDINILYGENGSGKSCICNILKSVSQNKNFIPEYKPEEVCLLFDDGERKYPANPDEWDKRKDEDDILFFDHYLMTVNANILQILMNGIREKMKMIFYFLIANSLIKIFILDTAETLNKEDKSKSQGR